MQKSFVFSLLLLLCLSSVGLTRSWMENRAHEERVAELPWLAEMDPIDFMGTTALGGLRPLLIDALAMSAYDAFARRDWYEALPIAELLCRLQPNLPAAWESNSWNMAYNIAASKREANKPDEEFAWVLKGIEFIRKGIRKNPDSGQVQWWLSFMMYDKGRYPEYGPRFEQAGIDTEHEAIVAAGEASKLEVVGFRSHYWYALLLARKLESFQDVSTDPRQCEEIARSGIDALEFVKARVPDEKDFREYREGIAERISFFEKVLETVKVRHGDQTKSTGDK